MGTSTAAYERRERLAHILDMLHALSGMAARDGSDMLRYFVELAGAQARDEYAVVATRSSVDVASRAVVTLN
jgi:hypothetical protein